MSQARDLGSANAAWRRQTYNVSSVELSDGAEISSRAKRDSIETQLDRNATEPPYTPFTTCSRSPRANACTVSIAIRSMFADASRVLYPMCGVSSTFGSVRKT